MITICAWCGALLRIHRNLIPNTVSHGICAVCRDDYHEEVPDYAELWVDIGGEGGGA